MKNLARGLLAALILAPAVAAAQVPSAADLAGIAENCAAPMAKDMEESAIPQLLHLGAGAAQIMSITDLSPDIHAVRIGPHQWELSCVISVKWTNGQVDRYYRFVTKEDRYGSLTGFYGPLDDFGQ